MQYKFHSFSLILASNAFILKYSTLMVILPFILESETVNGAFIA